MQTIAYEDIIAGVEDLTGLKRGMTDTYDWGRFQQWAARRLFTAWEFCAWPDLMNLERRLFRPALAPHTTDSIPSTDAGTERFYWPTGRYYVATGTTTLPPVDAAGVPRPGVWAELKPSYSGGTWATASTYTAGDVVQWAQNGSYYVSRTSSNSGNAPSNTTHWYLLPAFDRTIDFAQAGETEIGTVFGVYDKSPLLVRNAAELDYQTDGSYIRVLDAVPYAWVSYRQKCPLLTGDTWAEGAYAVGDQVYYETATLKGDFYRCIAAAEDEDPTDTTIWEKLAIPRIFYRYLVQAIYTDYLPGDGQNEKRNTEEAVAQRLLADQQFVAMQQQQQAPGFTVRTR